MPAGALICHAPCPGACTGKGTVAGPPQRPCPHLLESPSMIWTQEQDDRLRDLAAAGASAPRIAAALNRKIQIVRRRARELGYHVPTVREQRMHIQNAENERREDRSDR